nr:MAG TPA: hypothetical protein [Caudoviricetes sp.]
MYGNYTTLFGRSQEVFLFFYFHLAQSFFLSPHPYLFSNILLFYNIII